VNRAIADALTDIEHAIGRPTFALTDEEAHATGQTAGMIVIGESDTTRDDVIRGLFAMNHRLPEPPMRPASLPRPTKTPKPPADVQAAIKAKAEGRREWRRIRNLQNVGHTVHCAKRIV
jgi:hypothetical protein